MGILILNLTGNRDGFENAFCDELLRQVVAPVELVHARGDDIATNDALRNRSNQVLIIVAHAGPDGTRGTTIDIGLDAPDMPIDVWSQLNTPMMLMQTLPENSQEKVVVFCACEAISPTTLVEATQSPSAIGVVASRDKVDPCDCPLVAAIADQVFANIECGITDLNAMTRAVSMLVQRFGLNPSFRYFPPFRAVEC